NHFCACFLLRLSFAPRLSNRAITSLLSCPRSTRILAYPSAFNSLGSAPSLSNFFTLTISPAIAASQSTSAKATRLNFRATGSTIRADSSAISETPLLSPGEESLEVPPAELQRVEMSVWRMLRQSKRALFMGFGGLAFILIGSSCCLLLAFVLHSDFLAHLFLI